MIVLCIVGKLGSGKDTVSEYLCKEYGFSFVSYSEIVHQKVRDEGLETTRANLQKIATQYRETYGENVFAELVVEKTKSLDSKRIVLKEARTKQDVEPPIKEFGEKMYIIEVVAEQKTRFERLKARAGPKDAKEMKEFLVQEKREGELGYFGAAELADFIISNDGTYEELQHVIDELMEHLGVSKN